MPDRQSQEDLTTHLPRGAVGSKSSSAFLPCSLPSERSLLRPLSKKEERTKTSMKTNDNGFFSSLVFYIWNRLKACQSWQRAQPI